MANYEPPTENLPIFDPTVFATEDVALTKSEGDKRYLRYPNAQGEENLQAINVNGISTFNAAANFNQPITMTSATAADRTIQTTNLNINNETNTAVGIISGSASSIFYDNNVNSGTHNFYASNSSGIQSNPLNISSSSISANRPLVLTGGSSADRTLTTTNINVNNETNTAVGTISGSGNNIIYNNNIVGAGTHNFNKPIIMSSATVADREIESSTYTVLNVSNTDIGSVSYTSNSILYNSKTASARHVFNNTTSLGVNVEVMSMTADAGVIMTRPLVMTGTPASRAISSSSYKMLSGSNILSGEIAMSGADQIYYQNTVNDGNHSFLTRNSVGAQTTPLKITSAAIDVNTIMNINNGITPYGLIGVSAPNEIRLQNNINEGSFGFLTRNSVGAQTTHLKITSAAIDVNTIMNINNGITPYGLIGTSGVDEIRYQNNINGGNHTFLTRNSGGTQTTPLKITSAGIDVNTIMNINNGTIPYGVIGTAGADEIRYQNNINSGNHSFLVKNSVGTIITPLLLNSNGLIMTASGNYIQFPDGTQQSTAATSTPLKTYSEFVVSQPPNLTDKMVTIPPNCYYIDIVAIGSGGLAGATNVTSGLPGGAGGGGAIAKTTAKIVVSPGQQFNIIFSTDADGNFITGNTNGANNNILIRSPNAREAGDASVSASIPIDGVNQSKTNVIGVLKNGLNGLASTSVAAGAPAGAGTSPVFNTFATNWNVQPSTAGYTGGTLVNGQYIAGAPKGSRWLAGGYGSGQVSTVNLPGSLAGNAVVIFTYYIG